MLFLLSPAKSLDYVSPLPVDLPYTLPAFMEQAGQLVGILRTLAPHDIAALMGISDKLAALNVARYAAWSYQCNADNARQALFAFNGDVYEGLDAHALTDSAINWAQNHLTILSGLYGVLRPLDWMQPYRLEMGTKLVNPHGAHLYDFWAHHITEYLNQHQAVQAMPGKAVVVNLASQEYFKSIDCKRLKARVVDCVFEDYKGGHYKIISFHAKRARGLMARYAIQHQVSRPEQLQGFDAQGYAYAAEVSTAQRLVFRRNVAC